MNPKKERKKFPLLRFRWIFLVDSIVIMTAVMSFGAIAIYALGMKEKNAILMLYMIPPMVMAMGTSTYIIVTSIRKRLGVLLDGIQAVGDGDLDVCLETEGADEYKTVYEDFNRMVKELKATKEEMQAFTNEFSHEFKTPITSIQGFAQLLVNTGDGIETPDRMKYLQVIAYEATRLSELSQNTLLLSRVEACQIITDKESFDLSEQIKRVTIVLLPQIERKQIDLLVDLPDIQYYGNAELLEQVWINLLNNAVKFTPEHGEIIVWAECAGQEITVGISDNGVGMDEETVSHIFEKYYQGGGRGRGGNGIGLSIVKRIVTLCGGSVRVESVPGEGSTFSVSLPVNQKVWAQDRKNGGVSKLISDKKMQ